MTNNDIISSNFDLKTWREGFVLNVLRIACVLGIFLIIVSFPTATIRDRFLFIGMYLALIATTILKVPYSLRAYLLLFVNFAVGVNAILAWGPWADGSIFLLAGVVMASLLLDNKTDILTLTGSIIFTLVIALLQLTGKYQVTSPNAPAIDIASWAVYIADFSIAGIAITAAANQLKRAFSRVAEQMQNAFEALKVERTNLEDKVLERTSELETRMTQLRASANTARIVAETRELNELMKIAANLIAERFGYYHVGLYILDEQGKTAFLQAASSETGKSLIGQAFRLETDKRNPITSAVQRNQPVISSDSDRNTNFIQDSSFPLTRSRMIMPLAVRGLVIGYLDIHSDQPRAFDSQDAEILQILADLTAISFDNVRLIDETRYLLNQLETNSSIQTQRTWSKLTTRHRPAFLYTPAGVRPIFSQEHQGSSDGLRIPITLHGQTIGTIKLRRKGIATGWSEREQILVEKIAVQVGLALENSRLVDEAQKNALRNQMIANFSTYVRETLDIESVIHTAATELRNVFDLKEAEILIGAANSNIPERPTPS